MGPEAPPPSLRAQPLVSSPITLSTASPLLPAPSPSPKPSPAATPPRPQLHARLLTGTSVKHSFRLSLAAPRRWFPPCEKGAWFLGVAALPPAFPPPLFSRRACAGLSVVLGVGMFRGEERPPERRGEGAGAGAGAGAGPPPLGSQPHFLGVRGDGSLPGAASGAAYRPVRVHISIALSCMCL